MERKKTGILLFFNFYFTGLQLFFEGECSSWARKKRSTPQTGIKRSEREREFLLGTKKPIFLDMHRLCFLSEAYWEIVFFLYLLILFHVYFILFYVISFFKFLVQSPQVTIFALQYLFLYHVCPIFFFFTIIEFFHQFFLLNNINTCI